MELDRPKLIGLAVLATVVVFLAGFLPQRARANRNAEALRDTQFELRLTRLEGRLGAALTESLRSNYERSRQLMAEFFTELQANVGRVENAQQRQALAGILGQRDEIITLLSRAQPESSQRLMLLYTTYYAALNPGATAASTVTPPPPPTPAPAPAPAPAGGAPKKQ